MAEVHSIRPSRDRTLAQSQHQQLQHRSSGQLLSLPAGSTWNTTNPGPFQGKRNSSRDNTSVAAVSLPGSSSSASASYVNSQAAHGAARADVFTAVRRGSLRDLETAVAALKRAAPGERQHLGNASTAASLASTGAGPSGLAPLGASGSTALGSVGPGPGSSGTSHTGISSAAAGGASGAAVGQGPGGSVGLDGPGAVVDVRNAMGVTPLHVAVWRNHLPCIKSLLEAGADPDLRDLESGWSSLHRAFHFGHWAAAGILLAAGASLALQDSTGRTPLDLILHYSSQLPGAGTTPSAQGPVGPDLAPTVEVFSWGNGANYQLGTGAAGIQKVPGRLDFLQDLGVVAVAAARFHSAAIAGSGDLYTWGFGRGGRLGHPDFDVHSGQVAVIVPRKVTIGIGLRKVRVVAAAKHHTVAATEAGEVFTWGSNREGRLGYSVPDTQPTPRKVVGLRVAVVAVAASNKHSAAVGESGDVFTWGCNAHGQLGYGTTNCASNSTPRAVVEHLKGKLALQVSASKRHTVVLTADGEVWTWGHRMVIPRRLKVERDTRKAPGAPALRFHRQEKLRITGIAAGFLHSSLVTEDGLVFFWASHDPALKCHQLAPLHGERAISVSAGKYRTAVVTECGSVYVWDSKDPRSATQAPVSLGRSSLLSRASGSTGSGSQATCSAGEATTSSNSSNSSASLPGSSAREQSAVEAHVNLPKPRPSKVQGIRHATAIAVGELHSVALSGVHEPAFSFLAPLPEAAAAAGHAPPGEAGELGEGAPEECQADREEEEEDGERGGAPVTGSSLALLAGTTSTGEMVAPRQRATGRRVDLSRWFREERETRVVRPLKEMCEEVVARSVVELRNALQVLEVAEAVQLPHLVTFCQELVLSNMDVIATAVPQQLSQCTPEVLCELEHLAHWDSSRPAARHIAPWRQQCRSRGSGVELVHSWTGRRLPTPTAPHAPVTDANAVWLRGWGSDAAMREEQDRSWAASAPSGGQQDGSGSAAEEESRKPMRRVSSSPDALNLGYLLGASPSSSGAEDEGPRGRGRHRHRQGMGQGLRLSPSSGSPWSGDALPLGSSSPAGSRLLEGLRECEDEEGERALVGKQVRALRKKLQQISSLEQRRGEGHHLDGQQRAKLRSKREVEASLKVLESGGTLEEASLAGEAAAKGALAEQLGAREGLSLQDAESRRGGARKQKQRKGKERSRAKEGGTSGVGREGVGEARVEGFDLGEELQNPVHKAETQVSSQAPLGKEGTGTTMGPVGNVLASREAVAIPEGHAKPPDAGLRKPGEGAADGSQHAADASNVTSGAGQIKVPGAASSRSSSTSSAGGRKKGRKGGLSLFLAGALDTPPPAPAPQAVAAAAVGDVTSAGAGSSQAKKAAPQAPAWGRAGQQGAGASLSLKAIIQSEQSLAQMSGPPTVEGAGSRAGAVTGSTTVAAQTAGVVHRSKPVALHRPAAAVVLAQSSPNPGANAPKVAVGSPGVVSKLSAPSHQRPGPSGLSALFEGERMSESVSLAGPDRSSALSTASALAAAGAVRGTSTPGHHKGHSTRLVSTGQAGPSRGSRPAGPPASGALGRSSGDTGAADAGAAAAESSVPSGASSGSGIQLSLFELLQHSQQQQQQQGQGLQPKSEPVAVGRAGEQRAPAQASSLESISSSLEEDSSRARGPAWRKPGTPSAGRTAAPAPSAKAMSLRDIQEQQERQNLERRATVSSSGVPGPASSSSTLLSSGPVSSSSSLALTPSPPVAPSKWYRGQVEEAPRTSSIRCIVKEEQAMKELRSRFGAASVRILVPQQGSGKDCTGYQ